MLSVATWCDKVPRYLPKSPLRSMPRNCKIPDYLSRSVRPSSPSQPVLGGTCQMPTLDSQSPVRGNIHNLCTHADMQQQTWNFDDRSSTAVAASCMCRAKTVRLGELVHCSCWSTGAETMQLCVTKALPRDGSRGRLRGLFVFAMCLPVDSPGSALVYSYWNS